MYLSSWTGKAFNLIFFKSSILIQIALYFSNSFPTSIRQENILTYLLISGIIKTSGLKVLSKYLIRYLELVFV